MEIFVVWSMCCLLSKLVRICAFSYLTLRASMTNLYLLTSVLSLLWYSSIKYGLEVPNI